VVPLVESAQSAQRRERFGIADVAAERIAGVGRIGDDSTVAHDACGPRNESLLRMRGMDGEALRHETGTDTGKRGKRRGRS